MSKQSEGWSIQRLHKGSGKARWHTVAPYLSEYLAKTFGRDAQMGSTGWQYRLRDPNGKVHIWWPTGLLTENRPEFNWMLSELSKGEVKG